MKEKLAIWIAWHLPKVIVMWCYIRVVSKATTQDFANKTPDEVSVMDALKAWQ